MSIVNIIIIIKTVVVVELNSLKDKINSKLNNLIEKRNKNFTFNAAGHHLSSVSFTHISADSLTRLSVFQLKIVKEILWEKSFLISTLFMLVCHSLNHLIWLVCKIVNYLVSLISLWYPKICHCLGTIPWLIIQCLANFITAILHH